MGRYLRQNNFYAIHEVVELVGDRFIGGSL